MSLLHTLSLTRFLNDKLGKLIVEISGVLHFMFYKLVFNKEYAIIIRKKNESRNKIKY